MATTTVRVDEKTHLQVQEMAAASGRALRDVLADAVERYRRERLLAEANDAYRALRGDATAWAEVRREHGVWDVPLCDGLDDE